MVLTRFVTPEMHFGVQFGNCTPNYNVRYIVMMRAA